MTGRRAGLLSGAAGWLRRVRAGAGLGPGRKYSQAHFERLEADLYALIDLVAPYLKPDQRRFLREENAAGEYALTLETLVDYLVDSEQEETVGPEIRRRIYALAARMRLEGDSRFARYRDG